MIGKLVFDTTPWLLELDGDLRSFIVAEPMGGIQRVLVRVSLACCFNLSRSVSLKQPIDVALKTAESDLASPLLYPGGFSRSKTGAFRLRFWKSFHPFQTLPVEDSAFGCWRQFASAMIERLAEELDETQSHRKYPLMIAFFQT